MSLHFFLLADSSLKQGIEIPGSKLLYISI